MEEESEEVTSASPSPRRGRRSNASSASPEFEFWMVGSNPSSFPPPHLLSADELFADGVLLPLQLLHPIPIPIPNPNPNPNKLPHPHPHPHPQPQPSSGSKRWRDIFRVASGERRADDKERRRDRKGSAAAEIGINIWPFARSRSAGNGGGGGGAAASRSRAAAPAPGRKASSAPCSRSNSRGESSSSSSSAAAAGPPRRWAASPGRAGGVHVGRSSPVWQIRRAGKGPEPRDKVAAGGRRAGAAAGARVLRLNVNTCIGYRSHVSCRGDAGNNKKNGGDGVTSEEASGGGGGGGNGSLFNLRNLFSSKKVY